MQPRAGRFRGGSKVGGARPEGAEGEGGPREGGDGQDGAVGVRHDLGCCEGVEAWVGLWCGVGFRF